MAITSVKIRATITIGTNLEIKTPYILSFNVNKVRNSKHTFSASLKIKATDLSLFDTNEISISAGELNSENLLFTGFILTNRATPAWDDPSYVIVNITGSDILYKLEHERYTRRQIDALSKFAVIENVVRKAQTGPQFKVRKEPIAVTSIEHKMEEQKEDTNIQTSDLSRIGVAPKNERGIVVDVEIGNVILNDV